MIFSTFFSIARKVLWLFVLKIKKIQKEITKKNEMNKKTRKKLQQQKRKKKKLAGNKLKIKTLNILYRFEF